MNLPLLCAKPGGFSGPRPHPTKTTPRRARTGEALEITLISRVRTGPSGPAFPDPAASPVLTLPAVPMLNAAPLAPFAPGRDAMAVYLVTFFTPPDGPARGASGARGWQHRQVPVPSSGDQAAIVASSPSLRTMPARRLAAERAAVPAVVGLETPELRLCGRGWGGDGRPLGLGALPGLPPVGAAPRG